MDCTQCGATTVDEARYCHRCGHDLLRVDEATLPFFPVTTRKLLILSLCSFSIYELYWFYKNWQRIQESSREPLSPFWRAFFAPVFAFSLFGRVRDHAIVEGVSVRWNAAVLGTLFLLLTASSRLPEAWGLLWLGAVVPLIPVQRLMQDLNARSNPRAPKNGRFTRGNVATVVVGGLMLALAVMGILLPDEPSIPETGGPNAALTLTPMAAPTQEEPAQHFRESASTGAGRSTPR